MGPCVLERPLGKGASASVWLGRDDEGRKLALKIRQRGDPSMDRRFLREFESMRSLRLPGVVRVFDAGLDDNHLWFSMEPVDGKPFHEVVQAATDPAARVAKLIELGRQLLDVLAALHLAGFVHRDVKPSNVLVDAEGEVHVLDFGIVRFFADRETSVNTVVGQVLGTVPYMAPEQLAGLPADEKVDLFASGIMLHEALAGRRPRPAMPVGWIPRTCMERLPPLATLDRGVPRGLSALIEAMLAVDPADRPTADEAARWMRAVQLGHPDSVCPEPRWVEPGVWFERLDGLLGHASNPAVWVLEGPTGSGRRRAAEQVHRQGLLQGVWTLHLRCRVGFVGGPLGALLASLLKAGAEEGWDHAIAGDDGPLLRRVWPHLSFADGSDQAAFPSPDEIARAVTRCVTRAVTWRPMLLVFHDLEQIDALTARALSLLCEAAGPSLGVLLLHDRRAQTRESERVVQRARAILHAGHEVLGLWPEPAARELAGAVSPAAPPSEVPLDGPLAAVEAGLGALARWRGEAWAPPSPALWPLALLDDPVPAAVVRRASPEAPLDSPWVRRTDAGVALHGRFAWQWVRARIADPRAAAAALAAAWSAEMPADAASARAASLLLLAGQPSAAWGPAAAAAVRADRLGLYGEARRWLFLLDTLPAPVEARTQDLDLAVVRARVALRTEVGRPRLDLIEAAERLALTGEDEARTSLLRAEFDLRTGGARAALISALRVGSSTATSSPHTCVQALLIATEARFVLGQLDEIPGQLDRADTALALARDEILGVQSEGLRAEHLLQSGQLPECRIACQKTMRRAAEVGYVRGTAFSAARLGRVLRMLGRRREAEHQTRAARSGFATTGDTLLDAESGLALATLLVERGDTPGARHLLDETIRQIRSMHLDHLLAPAMRLALEIATFRADVTEAAVALAGLDGAAAADPEAPAALIRWWRTRGDVERALAVEGPADPESYGRTAWHVERARVAMMAGLGPAASIDARIAQENSHRAGFAELQLYAQLVVGVVEREDSARWQRLLERSASCTNVEVHLGALEMDARRLADEGETERAQARWRALWARSRELGYQPGVSEAEGWLGHS